MCVVCAKYVADLTVWEFEGCA